MTDATTPATAIDRVALDGGGTQRTTELRWIEWGATVLSFGVLLQAVLAGQFLMGRSGLIAAHRVLAEFLPIIGVAVVVFAWRQRATPRHGRALLIGAVGALIALVVQTGLGFAGRSSSAAAAIHVPVGVALLGLLVATAGTARAARQDEQTAGQTG